MSGRVIYLAQPYSHPDPRVRAYRAAVGRAMASVLMQRGYVVYAPIAHGESMVPYLPPECVRSNEFWMAQCLPLLERSDAMWVIPLPGYKESVGLAVEMAHAEKRGIRVTIYTGSVELMNAYTDALMLVRRVHGEEFNHESEQISLQD